MTSQSQVIQSIRHSLLDQSTPNFAQAKEMIWAPHTPGVHFIKGTQTNQITAFICFQKRFLFFPLKLQPFFDFKVPLSWRPSPPFKAGSSFDCEGSLDICEIKKTFLQKDSIPFHAEWIKITKKKKYNLQSIYFLDLLLLFSEKKYTINVTRAPICFLFLKCQT